MRNFHDIQIDINGTSQSFNFEYTGEKDDILWIVNSESKTLYLTEDLAINNVDMPEAWIQPAITALTQLLGKGPMRV